MNNRYVRNKKGYGRCLYPPYRTMNLRCLRDEKKRLFYKMVMFSRHDIGSLANRVPALTIEDHFFETKEGGNCSYFSSEDYDNNVLMTRGFANSSLFFLKVLSSSDSKYLKACYIAPCLYCFRHYVELTLKDTLWHYSRCGYNINIAELNDEHNLSALWDKLVPLTGRKDERTRNIGRLLHEISDVDKSGTTFRYSYHFSKNNRIQNSQINMRIENKVLYTRMLQIYGFLEGLNDEIVNGCDEISSYNT